MGGTPCLFEGRGLTASTPFAGSDAPHSTGKAVTLIEVWLNHAIFLTEALYRGLLPV